MADAKTAEDIAQKLSDEVFAFKIGWPLILGSDAKIIRTLSKYAKVICDLKVADIPNTNMLITKKVREEGAWGIITHAFPGKDSIEAVVKEAGDMKVFSVVVMSHPGASQFFDKNFKELIDISVQSNVYGFVGPGNKPELLSQIKALAGDKKIISPGVGAQGGDPVVSLSNGADCIIVGRAIYNTPDPKEAARKINSEITKYLNTK